MSSQNGAKPRWDGERTAAENAATVLPSLAEAFFEAGRAATASELPVRKLHRFRIKAKRFRYLLELFRPCYDDRYDGRLEDLKALQDALGAINDCRAARSLIDKASKRKRGGGRRRMRAFLRTRQQELRQQFQAHWSERFDAPGRLEEWRQTLSQPQT